MENQNQITGVRTLKFGISLLVFAATTISKSGLRVLGRKPKGTCIILYYHSVPREQRADFAGQLDVLLRFTKVVSIDDASRREPGVHHVAITFDDAFQNFVDEALPELQKRQLPCTMFVIADAMGKTFGQEEGAEQIMTLSQLKALPEDLVIVGSHTLTHPMLTKISKEDANREILESRGKIEAMLDRPVRYFSFPFGDFNAGLVPLCVKAGYSLVFNTLPVFAFNQPDEFVVGRVRVDPTDWPLEFRLKVAGAYRWLPWAFKLKRLVLSNPFTQTIRKWTKTQPVQTDHSQSMIRP